MSSSSSSINIALAMPGSFSFAAVPRRPSLVKTKAGPTTHVTTGEADWAGALQPLVKKNDKGKGEEIVQDVHSGSVSGSSQAQSRGSGSVARTHGLLTPHASIGEGLALALDQERSLSVASSRNTSSGPSTGSGESEFATPEGSFVMVDLPAAHDSESSVGYEEVYASVGVQTSPYTETETPSWVSTPPASPSRSLSATLRPLVKRKRSSTPAYIREGERMTRELVDDLTYLAQEKRNLRMKLRSVERKERELKSLLISVPGSAEDGVETETEEETADRDSSAGSPKRVRFRARVLPTPVSSKREEPTKSTAKNAERSMSRVVTSPSTSSASYASASFQLLSAVANRGSTISPTDSIVRGPGYTFAEGSSTSGSILSELSGEQEQTWRGCEDVFGLAPNPVHDPSTCLIWFDLETTDAVRPTTKIRILEVAVFITDKNYRRLDRGKSYIVHWPLTAEEITNEMPQRVRDMHHKSGLLSAYESTPPKERLSLAQVERRICKYLEYHDIEPNGRGVMAGAGVAFDRGMVRQHMERLDAYFGHQIFDTTTLWHVIRRKYNRSKRFSEICAHRALDDIIGSCNEAKLYSELVFKPSGEVHWPTRSSRGI